MVNFINGLGSAVDSACMGFIDTGVTIKKGLMVVGEVGSRAMYDVYSLEGFEKFSKAAIANMEAASLIPALNGAFSETLKTVKAQKDLIYATLIIGSMADFIKRNPDGSMSFALPTIKESDGTTTYDYVKILYGVGNIFETGCFFQKYGVMQFPLCSKLASQLGAIKIFNMAIADIPVLNTWTDKPKDFFVFFASGYIVWRSYQRPINDDFWCLENLVKLTGGLGKMVLISSADFIAARKYMVTLAVIDVATQNSSLLGLWLKRSREREKRMDDPT